MRPKLGRAGIVILRVALQHQPEKSVSSNNIVN